MELREKFNERWIPEPMSGCWLWLGAIFSDDKPYGQISHAGKWLRAHRVSYELHKGSVPADLLVCHRCDNPACVNPDHLFLGSPSQNSADMVRKGRSKSGVRNAAAKLTPADVLIIRTSAEPSRAMGRRFGVDPTTVQQIRRGQIWKTI